MNDNSVWTKQGNSGGGSIPIYGTWKSYNGTESITLNNDSFEISKNNKAFMKGTYTAAPTGGIAIRITMTVKEIHGNYLSEIEDVLTFESKWYSKNQVIDVYRKWLKEEYPSFSDTEISEIINDSGIFDALFPTKTGTIDGDTMIVDNTTYTKVTGG